ncbi:hypothetical protein J113_21480 [Mycobacterium tuberculosis CAS/NITR204]|uniref:Uncharacterized protein n=1 Tax=Mycobacterium tuberculosis CAS/NITR204 TaxID=1310114 RepID=R4MA12_MYCTX|nr:hypothetical protein J113_21480 [Mycobacterium tuberculosis CAS/NITR204]
MVFDARRDVEAPQKRQRVRAELAHQVGVPPQVGGADEAAQLHHLLSENDKRLSQSVNTWRGSSTMLEP